MNKYGIADFNCLIERANNDPSWYWDAVNDDLELEWFTKYNRVLDPSAGVPWTKWFIDGKCNIIRNAVDRHAQRTPEKIAYIFEGMGGCRTVTYGELDCIITRLGHSLRNAGVRRGDVVAIYMPMIPEAFFSILACSKMGAVHSTIFSGFGSQALKSRIADSGAKILLTSNTMERHGKKIDLEKHWRSAISESGITRVITTGENYEGPDSRVTSFEDFLRSSQNTGDEDLETEPMDSEDPLFILYTSGTTGKPKGTVQVHGGFTAVAAQQSAYLIDMTAGDTLFWYADIGWITGQTWVVYGSAICGGTSVVYEEALNFPRQDYWCSLVERHGVTILGMSPTAVRSFMHSGFDPSAFRFDSVRILAATGEPLNGAAWQWYYERVGQRRCPVINLSGGTEIGGAILSPLPGMELRQGTVGLPVPGFDADIFDESGLPSKSGYLVIKKPWPSMTRGLINDDSRFMETYWKKFSGVWLHGDIVSVDDAGLWYISGRSDDVIKIAGHRLSAGEVEAAALTHKSVSEAAAVGRPDDIRGESLVLCIVVKEGHQVTASLEKEIADAVAELVGKFARPDEVKFVREIPKTRAGKLVRKLVRAKVAGVPIGASDIESVENPGSLDGF